nr:hypothetical protein [Tanacetum cinerariifolium]
MRLLKLVDEPSAEDVLVEEPAYNEEEANLQRDLELSIKEQAKRTQGLARPVVIRELDSGRIQPLPNVQGKGKEKVVDEQATHDLLTLQTPKKKSHDEGQAGPNPCVQDEGQAGSSPGDAAESQPQSSHVVHARPNLEPIDLEATDASPLQNPEKMNQGTNAEAEVYLMISVPIHQDTSSVPPMTTLVIDLMTSQSGSSLLTSSATTSTKLENLNIPHQVSKVVDEIVTDAVDWAMQAPLQARFNQLLSDKEEALQKKRKRRDVPRTPSVSPPPQPPPLPPPAGASGAPAGLSGTQELSPTDSMILDDSILDEQVHLSDDQDSGNNHLPTADSRKGWWKPLPAEERPATPKPTWSIPSSTTEDMKNFLNWYYRQVNKTVLTQADLKGQAYEVVKAFYPDVIQLYKGSSLALSISKIKAASYLEFDLELLVSEQIWIDDVCTYDISAKYSMSHWWFNRQKFYIDRHASPSRQNEVRSTMRILNVVRIKAYSRYGYDYLSEIILRRADFQEHTIAEKDFKNLHPSDFEDLNLLLLQDHLDHLPGSDKRMLSTAVKLWTRNLVIRQRVEDF